MVGYIVTLVTTKKKNYYSLYFIHYINIFLINSFFLYGIIEKYM